MSRKTGGIFLKKRTKTLLTCLAVPLGVGAVSGFLTQGSMDAFEKLNQPPLACLLYTSDAADDTLQV